MTYSQLMSAATYTPDGLQQRIAYAVVKFARYTLGASQDATLLAWARSAIRDPHAQASLMLYAVVADAGYANAQADDDASDAALQTIVETLVNSEFKNA